jgi:hypothetical protein
MTEMATAPPSMARANTKTSNDFFMTMIPRFDPAICGCSNLGRARFSICELAHTLGVAATVSVASLFPTYRIRSTTVGNMCDQRRFAIARVVILSP